MKARGPGGKPSHRGALICEDLLSVALGDLRKRGGLAPGHCTSFADGALMFVAHAGYGEIYRQRIGDPQRIEYRSSRVADKPAHRLWFRCPRCGRGTAILYSHELGPVKCCHGALHAVTAMKPHERADYRAQAIRARLSLRYGIAFDPVADAFPERPRYMHRRNYARLAADHAELVERAAEGFAAILGIPYKRATPRKPLSRHPRT